MLRSNLAFLFVKVERDTVGELYDEHRSKWAGAWQAQKFYEKGCRLLLVAASDNGVVELHAHVTILLS
jgi:hypothetical protein